jgi:uncharacterized membrane protein YbhN (UPF0104 family)
MKAAKPLLATLVILITGSFFVKTLSHNWQNVKDLSLGLSLLSLCAIILFVVSVVSSGVLWGEIVSLLSKQKIKTKEAIQIHLVSWMLKYIPGQAGSYLNKLNWGVKIGLSKKLITNAFVYETVLQAFASIIPTIPIVIWLFLEDVSSSLSTFVPLLVVLPMLAVMNKRIFSTLINWISLRLRYELFNQDMFLENKPLWRLQLKFIIPRVINGAAFVFVAASLLPVSIGMYIPLAAIYVLAGIIGLLAIFVPSGLGVREAVIVLLAKSYFSTEEAIALALIARFYATIADVGVLGLFLVTKRSLKKT